MSAQLSQLDTTRLLIVDKSENSAHELDSALRDAGIATKLSISDDLSHIAQLIANGETDIALITEQIDGMDELIPRLREQSPHTPVILLTEEASPEAVVHALGLGATDAIHKQAKDQLAMVVKRELTHVSERRNYSQLRRALKEAEQRCQLLLQGSRVAIAYVHEGMHIHANENYLRLFDYADSNDICGVSLVDILSSESAAELKLVLKALRAEDSSGEASLTVTNNIEGDGAFTASMQLSQAQYEGEPCLQVTLEPDADSTVAGVATTTSTEQLELAGFVKAAEAFFSTSDGYAYIVVAEIDQITGLQNAYGLAGAETICRRVWRKFAEVADDYPITQLNNHQFSLAVIADSYSHLMEVAEAIRAEIESYIFEVQGKTIRPTISISGALVDSSTGVNATLDNAFQNLLDLRERSTANVVGIPNALAAAADVIDDAKIILRQINDAIEKKQFIILFQPIISLRGDSEEHYEVFLRMTNEEGEELAPARFLQTAIDHNVAGKIDRWVILQAIKTLGMHRASGNSTRLTINLSANSISDPEFLQWLGVAIKAARLPSDAVIFQITEKDASTYLRQTREFIDGLKEMHCRASLSRFGVNESSFETLRHLCVDIVKLDGNVVVGIDEDDSAKSQVVETIKQLQSGGKLTVVPMVENANILSTLWQAGANYIQGHYLQEPTTEMDYDFSTED